MGNPRHLIVFTTRLESVAACDQLDYTNENWDALSECGWESELECHECEVLRVTALANGFNYRVTERSLTLFVIWATRMFLDADPVTIEESKWRAWKVAHANALKKASKHGSEAT